MSGQSRLTPGSSLGSCLSDPQRAADWIHRSPHSSGASGIERIEALFHHAGYAMHRHLCDRPHAGPSTRGTR
jgi:hypothetical protein